MLKVSKTSSQGAVVNKINEVNEHDNNENERVSNTHGKGERVKIPILPNKVGKRSRTMTMVMTPLNMSLNHFMK